ncbi:MAG: S8 family serine peptidase, partial [Dehalococcoidia bacterium]
AATAGTGGPSAAAAFAHRRNIHLVEGKAKVVIEAEPGMVGAAKKAAVALGADIDATYENLVRVLAPVSSLTALANNPAIRLVRQPQKPVPLAVSEGMTLIDADDWQSAGFTGAGVKIGIVDIGYAGYAALKGTELPASVTTQWFGSGGTEGSSVHGTAVAEIIYDIAPNAEFYLTNVDDGIDFGNAVDWLIAQGVDVISCSLGWILTAPGDGTGHVSDKVTEARAAGILWANSAGNQARRNWVGPWVDTDSNGWHDFAQSPRDESNAIYAYAGYSIVVGLRWDDTWGASGNDYDLYLYKQGGPPVAYSLYEQNGNDDPAEFISFTALSPGWYHIVIAAYCGPPPGNNCPDPVNFQLMTFSFDLQYQNASHSIMEPADSPGAVAVGAVPWANPTSLEVFSSQGPTADGRTKPDLVAPDGVTTIKYGPGNGQPYGAGGTGFFGTSASAPHVAGAAALVKNAYPSYTPAQVQSFLETRAIDLGVAGKDNLFGSGMLNLGAPPVITEPPAVTTNAATDVTTNSATLNATLDGLGTASPVNVSFQWGTTIAYGNNTAPPQAMTGTGNVTAGLTGLQPGTTYHFRAKAAGDGTTFGSDQTFETCVPGDANMDDIIDGRDVIRAKKIILGLEDETCGADAYEDGVIDGRDVIRIKKMILGIADP